jgi:phosphoribosylanthranilate isomerase
MTGSSRADGAAAAPSLLVKICGITTEEDALLAIGLGADAVGFVFAPSPRQMTAQAVRQIVDRLPRGVLTVGVFRDQAPVTVVETVNRVGLDAAQLHGAESADDTRWIAERVPMVIRGLPVGHPEIGEALGYGAQLVLVDARSPGSGEVFDWTLAEGVVDPGRLIVAGGLHSGNVAAAIAHLRPRGVDVSSGVESAPGRKDPVRLAAFIAAARAASDALASDGAGIPDAELARRCDRGPFDWRTDA